MHSVQGLRHVVHALMLYFRHSAPPYHLLLVVDRIHHGGWDWHDVNESGYDRRKSLNPSPMIHQRKIRQTSSVCGIYSRLLQKVNGGINMIPEQHALLDDFFPAPSLSTTSSLHTTDCRSRFLCRGPPRRWSVPISPSSSPDGRLSSSRGCESRIVIVREPSDDAEADGLFATRDMLRLWVKVGSSEVCAQGYKRTKRCATRRRGDSGSCRGQASMPNGIGGKY